MLNIYNMLNNEILFITIILFLLIFVGYLIKVPRAIFPLSLIYLIFILTMNREKKPNSDIIDKIKKEDVDQSINSSKILERNKKQNPSPVNLADKLLKPKPLIFNPDKKDNNYKIELPNDVNKPEDNKDVKIIDKDIILLKDIKICKTVINRNPVDVGTIFINNVDSLFCFTKIQNSGRKREIRHVWYYKNELQSQIKYNIRKSNIYRSWTMKRINQNQIGDWRVDVLGFDGSVLGSTDFIIIKK